MGMKLSLLVLSSAFMLLASVIVEAQTNSAKKTVRRGPASAETSVTCASISEWLKACRAPGPDEQGRRRGLRQLQSDFAQARAANPEIQKQCSDGPALETCLVRLGGALSPANPREKLLKSDNSRELLQFGSLVLMKSGVPPARAPAQQKNPRN